MVCKLRVFSSVLREIAQAPKAEAKAPAKEQPKEKKEEALKEAEESAKPKQEKLKKVCVSECACGSVNQCCAWQNRISSGTAKTKINVIVHVVPAAFV
jgi:hypothetical protein